MIGHLIRKEILDQILSFRFVVLAVVGACILWLSLYDGYAYYRDALREYRLAEATTEARVEQLRTADDWGEFHNTGYLIHKPPSAMSIFVRGLDPTSGRSFPVWGGLAKRLKRSPVSVRPLLGVFPALDLGLVVEVVLSLFVLLLTFDAVCGEKEGGTLRLIAAFPVPRHLLLLGKFVGTLVPALAAFGLPLLLGIAVVLLLPGVQFSEPEGLRLVLILLGFVLYLVVFTCAGLFASCLARRAATSFVLLLAFWVAVVSILPRLGLVAADAIRPAPSVYELQAQKDAVMVEGENWRHERMREWQEENARQAGEEWFRTPEGRVAYRLHYSEIRQQMHERSQVQLARLEEAFENRYRTRLDLAVLLGRTSPAFALGNATMHLAETGLDRHRRFLEAAQFFHGQSHRDWVIRTKDLDWLKRMHPAKYGEYEWDVSDMPRFYYREVWPEESVQAALVDLGVLGVWALVLFAGAYGAVIRYDVR